MSKGSLGSEESSVGLMQSISWPYDFFSSKHLLFLDLVHLKKISSSLYIYSHGLCTIIQLPT